MHKTRGLAERIRVQNIHTYSLSILFLFDVDVDIVRGHIRTVVPNPSWLNLARPRLWGTPGDVCKSRQGLYSVQ